MTQFKQIYKCPICGNVVEVLRAGVGTLVCCGQSMELQSPKTQDEGAEKHLPVIEDFSGQTAEVKIKVGAMPHPMLEEHYIEWIEIITNDGKFEKKFLKPGELAEANFNGGNNIITVRVYCNVHGLWEKKIVA